MPFAIQPIHIVIILVIALLIFGPKKLPDMGRNLGRTITEFRKGTREMTDGFRQELNPPEAVQGSGQTIQSSPVVLPTSGTAPTSAFSTLTSGAPSSEAEQFCIQCGAPNGRQARFCNVCGGKLPENPA